MYQSCNCFRVKISAATILGGIGENQYFLTLEEAT